MILNLFATAFVLGATFVHSMYGLFSGIINLFCCVVALAITFGYFEVANNLASQHLHPGYTEPFVFILLFVISLLLLRLAADNFVRGNMRVPMYVDWGGGAVCGFFIAQICVGVMFLGFMMLPFGGQAGMYQREVRPSEDDMQDVPSGERVPFDTVGLWLGSEAMTANLGALLSSGSLSGTTEFASVYPNFPEWVWWTGNTVQPESLTAPIRDDDGDGFENGLQVDTWWTQTTPLDASITRYRRDKPSERNDEPRYEPMALAPEPGEKLLGVRMTLRQAAEDRDKRAGGHRFRATMIRIVGDVERPDGTVESQQYRPQAIGGADPRIPDNWRIADPDNNFFVPSGNKQIDTIFVVDEDFEPRFVEYRRHARAPVLQPEFVEAPPAEPLVAEVPVGGGRFGGGPSSFIDTVNRRDSGDEENLPFKLSANKLQTDLNVNLEGEFFVSGRVAGYERELTTGPARIEKFKIPAGKRIFQLQTKARQASSLAGQVFNFVGSITNSYEAIDSRGDSHPLAGFYVQVERDGQDYIELFFEPDPGAVGFNGMLQWQWDGVRKALTRQNDAVLGLIFVVPPSVEINTIRAGSNQVDLGRGFKMRSAR